MDFTGTDDTIEVHVDSDGTGPDTISLSFHLHGKLHNMARQKSELISATLKRLSSTLNKSKDKKRAGGKRSPAKAASPQAAPTLFDAAGEPIADWSTLTNSDWRSGMAFALGGGGGPVFRVRADPPLVSALSCFPRGRAMAGCCLAASASLKRADRARFEWFAESPVGVAGPVLVGEGPLFCPDAALSGHRLKLTCTPECSSGGGVLAGRPCVLYLSGEVSDRAPEPASAPQQASGCDEESAFRVMSYNILADVYASTDYARKVLFSYVSDEMYLHEDYRAQLVMNELMRSRADIICLQEVEQRLAAEYLSPCLSEKTEGSPATPHDSGLSYHLRYTNKNGNNREGCAMLVSRARFHVVFELDVPLGHAVFADPAFRALIDSHAEVADILGARVGTVAQLCVLQDVAHPARVLIVSNSHYFYHPKANYVRLMHTKVLLDIIEEIKNRISSEGDLACMSSYRPFYTQGERFLASAAATDMALRAHEPLPAGPELSVGVVFMGDLNSRPGTAAEQLLRSGFVDRHHPVWRGVDEFFWSERPEEEAPDPPAADSAEAEAAAGDTGGGWPISIGHSLSLRSVVPADRETYFTNYTRDFKDVLDYIFISEPTMSVVRPPAFPSVAELSEETAIPSRRFPSDHVALVADVKFR